MSTKENEFKNKKKPWPTKDAMEQVYAMQLWGKNESKYYSGDGSHHLEIVKPYIDVVTAFLTSFERPVMVCDLGCGDFNVAKELVQYTAKYVAVDIVEDLIAYNKKMFKRNNLEFHCLDIAVDDLPPGDCALLRQVVQHLSNAEIQSITTKLAAYEYVIITEHMPIGDFIPNKDILSGQGNRMKYHSGVDLLVAPFNLKIKESSVMLSVELNDGKGVIVTTCIKMF